MDNNIKEEYNNFKNELITKNEDVFFLSVFYKLTIINM